MSTLGLFWEAKRARCSQPGLSHLTPNAPACSKSSTFQSHEASGAAPIPSWVMRDQQHCGSPVTQHLPFPPAPCSNDLQKEPVIAKFISRNIISCNLPLFAINNYCAPVSPFISIRQKNKATALHKSLPWENNSQGVRFYENFVLHPP